MGNLLINEQTYDKNFDEYLCKIILDDDTRVSNLTNS